MAQIATTREQSQRLLDLGIPANTADMSWHFTNMKTESLQWELKPAPLTTKENFLGRIEKLACSLYKHADGTPMTGEEVFDKIWGNDLPAWFLGALIALLPDEVRDERFNVTYYLTFDKYGIWYGNRMEDEEKEYEDYGDLFECCIDMIEFIKVK
jgi:conserved domain protein|nr:MAG TPA: hypothetical protein [Caudoviricetes sp.]